MHHISLTFALEGPEPQPGVGTHGHHESVEGLAVDSPDGTVVCRVAVGVSVDARLNVEAVHMARTEAHHGEVATLGDKYARGVGVGVTLTGLGFEPASHYKYYHQCQVTAI